MYLGYSGGKIKEEYDLNEEYDWYCCKFGGSTEKLERTLKKQNGGTETPELPVCNICGQKLIIVCQIHSPRSLCLTPAPPTSLSYRMRHSVLSQDSIPLQGEDDCELRTLILFSCNEESCCSRNEGCWAVRRYQPMHVDDSDGLEIENNGKKLEGSSNGGNPVGLQINNKENFANPIEGGGDEVRGTNPDYGNKSSSEAPNETKTNPQGINFELKSWDHIWDHCDNDKTEDSNFDRNKFSFGFGQLPPRDLKRDAHVDNFLEKLLKIRNMSLNPPTNRKNRTKKKNASKPSCKLDMRGFLGYYIEFDKDFDCSNENLYSYPNDSKCESRTIHCSIGGDDDKEWAGELYENSSQDEKVFFKFLKTIERSPEQCLRYWRGYEPTYYSPNHAQNIPVCENCGAKRVFEFQVMPGLLSFLKPIRDQKSVNLDYGTVIIYTCSNSCQSENAAWFKEFALVQKSA